MRTVSGYLWRYRTYVLAGCIAVLGLTRSILTYRLSFGLGDPSTFYIFSRNTALGEVIYKDYIHFRMPGFYYYCAAFIKTFGDNYASVSLAMSIESSVLYPIVLFTAGKLITRSNAIAGIAATACVLVSGIFQLRAGLGLLAVALYVAACNQPARSKLWLLLCGIVLGLDFVEGQEIFLFACASIGIVEIITGWRSWREAAGRLLRVSLGVAAVIGPFLLFIAAFSNFKTFLYYAFDYALIIQPKFMNLPFPSFTWANWVYYLPIALYAICIILFWCTRRFTKSAVIVLSFGILRLASALGRADEGHLIFSIPELFIIVPWALGGVKNFDWRRVNWRMGASVICLFGLFGIATKVYSGVLLGAPIVLSFLLIAQRTQDVPRELPRLASALAAAISAVAISLFFIPGITGTYQALRVGAHFFIHGLPANVMSGVIVPEPYNTEVADVTRAIRAVKPEYIFSYPIEPFFYSVDGKHATRFITFEPQTTPLEIDQAIADLERTKPAVVVMDMLQAEELSPSLWRLNDYIISWYEPASTISSIDYIKVLKRRAAPVLERHLLLEMFVSNAKHERVSSYHIKERDGSTTDALRTDSRPATFSLAARQPAEFSTSVRGVPTEPYGGNVCGTIDISRNGAQLSKTICESDGLVRIDVTQYGAASGTISLRQQGPGPMLWIDPKITAIRSTGGN